MGDKARQMTKGDDMRRRARRGTVEHSIRRLPHRVKHAACAALPKCVAHGWRCKVCPHAVVHLCEFGFEGVLGLQDEHEAKVVVIVLWLASPCGDCVDVDVDQACGLLQVWQDIDAGFLAHFSHCGVQQRFVGGLDVPAGLEKSA
jgi:hypothetical protein